MKKRKEILNNRHELIDIYKMSKGCEICGYNKYPYNLCLDHLPEHEKSKIVKNANGESNGGGMYRLYNPKYSIKDLINEIKKCRILCNHCHTEFTRKPKNSRSIDTITERITSIEILTKKMQDFESS